MNNSLQQEIEEIEQEIQETPYNKSTEKHIGRLKAKLSSLQEKLEKKQSSSSGGEGYSVPKTGDRTVVLMGYPSVGKSTLLSKLTNADSETAQYDFTTLKVVPGMLKYKGADIQILDVPGLIHGASSGKGSGKKVLSVVRNADLILRMVDVDSIEKIGDINQELYDAGIRLDKSPPKITINQKEKGGISITSSVEQNIEYDTIKSVLREYKISNARISFREKVSIDDLIDELSGNKVYLPALTVVNKIDKIDRDLRKDKNNRIYISAEEGFNLDYLKEKIYDKLDLMRVYLKPQQGSVDKKEPVILEKGSTIEDVCKEIHTEFKEKFEFARVWGPSSKFDGQQVGLDHKVGDGDIVQLIMKNI
ncbi:GTP-binding protein [archaeon SCG-AAA382B04]|nr:GTP-binding protein [archaeon SCG-AAA382B04]